MCVLAAYFDYFLKLFQNTFGGKDVFSDVIPMCDKNFALMTEVFNNPEQVMGKFVLNIYHLKLQVIKTVLYF